MVCPQVSGSAELTKAASSTLTIGSLAYTGCTIAGQKVTVNTNGCAYKLSEPTGGPSSFTVNPVTIECPAGKAIVFEAKSAGCSISYGPQTANTASSVANEVGPPSYISLNLSLFGLSYTSSGGICGGSSEKSGHLSGPLALRGYRDALHTKATSIFVE